MGHLPAGGDRGAGRGRPAALAAAASRARERFRPGRRTAPAGGAARRGGRAADHRRAPAGAARPARRGLPGRAAGPGRRNAADLITDADGRLLATTSRPELERIARRGCPDHPDDTGTHDTGTDADALATHDPDAARGAGCGCPVLTAPPPVDRYTPSPAQRRCVQARDRTCRHPGCGRPAARADLDHCLVYANGGTTDCDNLCCLCRRHHRLKTLARGWRFVLTGHGVLRVTTPSGITRTTRPPGLRDLTELPALPAPPGPPPPWDEPPF